MLAVLHVVAVHQIAGPPCTLELDEFVPLQLRTYGEALGAGYVRLGNYSTTLMEIAVAPHSQVVRGITITSYDVLSPWPEFSVTRRLDGLPVVSTHFEGWHIVDIQKDFRVSVRQGEILAFWGELDECAVYEFSRVRFLARDNVLLGAWFLGLTHEEIDRFRSHGLQK